MKKPCLHIEVPVLAAIPDQDRKQIEALLDSLPASEFDYDLFPDKLLLQLRILHFEEFEKNLNTVITDCVSSEAKILLRSIIENIASIKSYGLRTGKRLYVEYSGERKVANREKKEKQRGQYYYTAGHSFSPQNNTLAPGELNKIHCADSESFLKTLPDNCIDVILTSPPYNFGLEYSAAEDDHKWEKYFEKLFAVFSECIRVIKYGGRIIVNIQPLFSDYIPSHHLISSFFIKNKMIWKGEILWEKNNYNCKYTAWGSWKSPSNPYLKYTWEFLEIFCKGDLKKTGERRDIDITPDEFKKWVYAKWSIAPEKRMQKYAHPAMFPEELVRRVLKLFSYKKDLILDPFNGAGTTTAVAKLLDRDYIGIDISPEYCSKATIRLDEETTTNSD